jgi:CHAD domain-containing protein
VTDHREVEQTYAPPPGASLPDLTMLPGVVGLGDPEVVELSAAYFDTPDLALLRSGVTVRRRTGGHDEGWHAKVPAGTGRDEVQRPLGVSDGVPPAELLALVRGWTRGAPVGEVARIETRRTERALLGADGTVLAELAQDEVTGTDGDGRRTAWCEWELELVDGEASLLASADELMEGAGVAVSRVPRKIQHVLGGRLAPQPRTGSAESAGEVLRGRLAEQVEELLRRDSQIRRGMPEGVHQARVACRRLRAALATFRPVVDRAVTDPVRDELRWFGRELAEARDAVVVRRRLEAMVEGEPRGLVGDEVRPRLATTYDGRGRAAAGAVAATLDSDRYFALLDALERLVATPPFTAQADRTADEVMLARVRKDWERLAAGVAGLGRGSSPDPAWHQVRKDAKRLRYAAEALEPVRRKKARRLAGAAKMLTSHLGERQDTVVARSHLVDIAAEAEAAGEGSFTWGRLHAREEAGAAALDRAFPSVWASASRKRLRSWLTP